jgi:hypothetical protein
MHQKSKMVGSVNLTPTGSRAFASTTDLTFSRRKFMRYSLTVAAGGSQAFEVVMWYMSFPMTERVVYVSALP